MPKDKNEAKSLDIFKINFQQRLQNASNERLSYLNIEKPFRRLDSFARLLEGNATCAAVYLDAITGMLWIANNMVFEGSQDSNAYIKNIHSTFELISNEKLSIEDIFEQLKEIIILNFNSQNRYEVSALKKINPNIQNEMADFISNQLEDLFKSSLSTKKWYQLAINALEYPSKEFNNFYEKVIKAIVKQTRDFLKIRSFLLNASEKNPLSEGLLIAVREKKYQIIKSDKNQVHAEMRLAEPLIDSNSYIGLSKLCCDHCHLAIQTFGLRTRGVHGQSFDWPIPSFIKNKSENFRKYVGKEAFDAYCELSDSERDEAQTNITSKRTGAGKKDRRMIADSSDSDIEFGPNYDSDEEKLNEIKGFNLADTWTIRHLNMCYTEEVNNLDYFGFSISKIINLYTNNIEKFNSLSSSNIYNLVLKLKEGEIDGSSVDIIELLEEIYDNHKSLFFEITTTKADNVIEHGLAEFYDRYKRKFYQQKSMSSGGSSASSSSDEQLSTGFQSGAERNIADEVEGELVEENGWELTYHSDDSQNCWRYNSGAEDNNEQNSDYHYDEEINTEEHDQVNDEEPDEALITRINQFNLR